MGQKHRAHSPSSGAPAVTQTRVSAMAQPGLPTAPAHSNVTLQRPGCAPPPSTQECVCEPNLCCGTQGGSFVLGAAPGDTVDLLVFYRGLHCPICAKHLLELERLAPEFASRGVQWLPSAPHAAKHPSALKSQRCFQIRAFSSCGPTARCTAVPCRPCLCPPPVSRPVGCH